MKKKILAAVVAMASVLSLVGCGEKNTSSTSEPAASNGSDTSTTATDLKDDDDTLSILTWSSNGDLAKMIKMFCADKGISEDKVKFVACGESGEQGREAIAQYLKGDGDADLIICDADWVRIYANDDTLTLPMSELGITKDQYPDSYAYTSEGASNKDGVLKAPTFQATPGAFVYRSDLAEQYLGVKTPAEMTEKIKDWDTFLETAKTVAEKSENKCALQCTEGGLWQVWQCSRTQPWVVDNKLQMDNAEDFMDYAKNLLDAKGLSTVGQWSDGWTPAMQDGTAMGEFLPTWALTGTEGSKLYEFGGTDYVGKFEVCDAPSKYFWGGSYIAAATKINTKKTAADFIKFYTQDYDSMKKYCETEGDFMNNKKVMDDVVAAKSHKNPILKDNQDQFAILNNHVSEIDLKPTEYDSKIKGYWNDAVQLYLGLKTDVSDWGSTKEDAINWFKDQIAKIGRAHV